MKSTPATLTVLASALTLLSTSATPQDTQPESASQERPQFQPGFDDVMTMLVQPRHAKLYASGQAHNWELAAFQLRELRSAFRRAGQYIPKYRDTSVDQAVESIMGPSLKEIEEAIREGDANQFTRAYANLTAACNSCHVYMEYEFLVMKVPSQAAVEAAYPDQQFGTSSAE